MPNLKNLIEETEDLEIPIKNEVIKLTYRVVGGFDADEELAMSAAVDAGDNEAATEAWAEMICATVVSWDVDEDGVVIPLVPEAVRKLKTPLMQRIMRAIREDRDPKNSGNASNGKSNNTGTGSSGWRKQYSRNGRR